MFTAIRVHGRCIRAALDASLAIAKTLHVNGRSCEPTRKRFDRRGNVL